MTDTKLKLRVSVTDVWDVVELEVSPDMTMAELKERVLTEAISDGTPAREYEIKFRGGVVLDETRTVGEVGVPQNGALIVLPRHKHPVS